MSEPVKPIIYYVDRGAPEPVRSALIEGASWWNQAFEAAGYKNAFIVKLLPEDADPMDIRYNIIQWVHRSTRGWSYGASINDPRTGEIIKGQVSLGSLRDRQDYLIAEGLLQPYEDGKPVSDKMLQLALARLRQLSAHEVGHTLGLQHNFTASVNDRASVMDYPPPVVSLNSRWHH
jgi:predicted Zn-dependent protease